MLEETLLQLKRELQELPEDKMIEWINIINLNLADILPFDEPIASVRWVKSEKIDANEYNPNKVAKPEMELLYESIKIDGYTQPIVAYQKEDDHMRLLMVFTVTV